MIHRTEEGLPFSKLAWVRGKLVDSAGDLFRKACEARYILAMPTRQDRRAYLDKIAKRRGVKNMQDLEAEVLAEYDWANAQYAAQL